MSFASSPPPVKNATPVSVAAHVQKVTTVKNALNDQRRTSHENVPWKDLVKGEDLDELLRLEALDKAIVTSRRIVVDGWPLTDFELRNFLLREKMLLTEAILIKTCYNLSPK
ncbi:hypothetical protein INT47_012451 [Mucor saturninus]|uniref:Uncharacterized protein n=1 Tax=Mucor saturninus TaxID=64648 RepID=A0A8H7QXN4_9FUNG|nr:hypothetical protein INT47_012451 [Mucor saturninus]